MSSNQLDRWPEYGFRLVLLRHLSSALVLILPSLCLSASPAPAFRYDVFSPNNEFVLDVDPKATEQRIFARDDRTKPLWSFKLGPWKLYHPTFLLAPDGKTAAVLDERWESEEDLKSRNAVRIWNKDGLIKAYSVDEICPSPPRTDDLAEGGPKGPFWRTWYLQVHQDGDEFTIDTAVGKAVTLSLETGNVKQTRNIEKPRPRFNKQSGSHQEKATDTAGSGPDLIMWTVLAADAIAIVIAIFVLLRKCALPSQTS